MASVGTVPSKERVTRASRLPRRLAAHQIGKVITTATTTWATLGVIGMAVIVVVSRITNTAKSVNVRTVHILLRVIHASRTSRKAVALPSLRAMVSVTTTTIMVA